MARSGMASETQNRSPLCTPIGRHYLGQGPDRNSGSPEGQNETVGYFGPEHFAMIREALTTLCDGRRPSATQSVDFP